MNNDIIIFPIWTPSIITRFKISNGIDRKDAFRAFRNSSSNFIKNKVVRDYIMNKYNNKCIKCNGNKDIEIDHILSVYYCFHNDLIEKCNTKLNLQLLCKKCNTSKQP